MTFLLINGNLFLERKTGYKIELHEFIKTYDLNLNVLRINSHKDHCEYEFYDQSNLATLPHTYFVINGVPVHYATSSFVQIMDIGLTTIVVHKEKFFGQPDPP